LTGGSSFNPQSGTGSNSEKQESPARNPRPVVEAFINPDRIGGKGYFIETGQNPNMLTVCPISYN